eukprot:gene10481-19192_t
MNISKRKLLCKSLREKYEAKKEIDKGARRKDAAVKHRWFLSARSSNILASGQILKEEATQYSRELEIENFKAANGLLERWEARDEDDPFRELTEELSSLRERNAELALSEITASGVT